MKKLKLRLICMILIICCVCGFVPARAATIPEVILLSEAIYDDVGPFSEGAAFIQKNGKYSYVDTKGSTIISEDTIEALIPNGESIAALGNFHDAIAYIATSDQIIFIDKDGHKKQFPGHPNSFSEGVTVVTTDNPNELLVVDTTGDVLAQRTLTDPNNHGASFAFGNIFSDDLLPIYVFDENDSYIGAGFVDKNLSIAIDTALENVRPFNNGLAPASKNGKWGFIDKTGNFVIDPKYDDFWVRDRYYNYEVFSDGLACVATGNKWGFIDKTGNTVIAPIFSSGGIFTEGLCAISTADGMQFYDTSGALAFEDSFDDAGFYSAGYTLAGKNGIYKLLDKNGIPFSDSQYSFDAVYRTYDTPNTFWYLQGDKWGLAEIRQVDEYASVWAADYVKQAEELGIIPGEYDGRYGLTVKRYEFCAFAVKLIESLTNEQITQRSKFSDTDDINVEKLAGLGIVKGTGDNKFDPDLNLTREQAAVILANIIKLLKPETQVSEPKFSDNSKLAAWSYDAVGIIQNAGIVNGTGNNEFSPQAPYTREQCIITLVRTAQYI